MTTVTITGDSPEAVALALMEELRLSMPDNIKYSEEHVLALYRRCLATVRGIDPSGTESKPMDLGYGHDPGYGSLGQDAVERS